MKHIAYSLAFILLVACTQAPPPQVDPRAGTNDESFTRAHDTWVIGFLRLNPVVSTYLGGSGLDPSLVDADTRFRDHSAEALRKEDEWLTAALKSFESFDEATLSPRRRIDRALAITQLRFLLHQHQVRRYQERALDTYMDEPFRAIDWQLQGMTSTGGDSLGTPEEWSQVIARLEGIPPYMETAKAQILAGVASGNTPDFRMIKRNGIDTAEANAKYFETTLPELAKQRLAGTERMRVPLLTTLQQRANEAARAYRGFRQFLAATFFDDITADPAAGVKPQFRTDRWAMGEEEYNWALKYNLGLSKNAGQLFEESWPVVEATRNEMFALARQIGVKNGWTLPAEGPAAVQKVVEELSKDYPKSDAEMVQWYRDAAFRLVEYGRKAQLFDIPADYKLDVVETPPPLRAAIDGAAYYPAPIFKSAGTGRFYLTTTDNDIDALKSNNRASVADLAAHEGFPGHDWHYKVMTMFKDQISPVRWLSPGAVEDSSSMWQDSLAAEGWGLYAEALLAEPQPGFPNGLYTPEERLYQLQGKLYRDLRVRIDTGIHTGRMTYDEAVDLFSEIVDFQPGSCRDPEALKSGAKRASCASAERAIFRYSKWPTQAITYRLGKEQIFALRKEAETLLGRRFSAKAFHMAFMKQGPVPVPYLREELLRELQGK